MQEPKQTHLVGPIKNFIITRKASMTGKELDYFLGTIAGHWANGAKDWIQGYKRAKSPVSPHSCTKCYLQNWFKWNRYLEEPLTAQVRLNFRLGNVAELELWAWANLAGEDVSHYQHGMLDKIGDWDAWHFIDFIHKSKVDGIRRVVDVKTMSSFSFDRLRAFEAGEARGTPMEDTFGYLGQANRYIATCLKENLIDPPGELIFLGLRKDTGALLEHVVPFQRQYVELADENCRTIAAHTVMRPCPNKDCKEGAITVGEGEETEEVTCPDCRGVGKIPDKNQSERPPRPPGYVPVQDKDGDWKLELRCQYCSYKHQCWTKPHQDVAEWSWNEHGNPSPRFAVRPLQQVIRTKFVRGKPSFIILKGVKGAFGDS